MATGIHQSPVTIQQLSTNHHSTAINHHSMDIHQSPVTTQQLSTNHHSMAIHQSSFNGYQSINHTPTVLENAFTNVTRTGSRRWWLWWQKYARVRSFSSPSVSPSCTCRKQARDFYCIQCCGAGGAAIRLRLHLLKTNKICQHWIDINIFKFSLVF